MSAVSFEFLLFFVLVLLLYGVFPQKSHWMILLMASLIYFYRVSGIMLLLVFLGLCFINWKGAAYLNDLRRAGKQKVKIVYIAIIAFNVITLVGYKEINFFKRTLNGISEIVGNPLNLPDINIIAPIGISYFSLILIGYLTDVYWEKYEPERNYLRFLLFVGYFPQISLGPIVRYDYMYNELFEIKKMDVKQITSGMERILWGFFKKLVIAERLSVIVNTVYGDYITYNGWYIFIAVFAFTLQLYADFSGAMDIVIGVSECFGITLPENFELPFWSVSISEFWRRWHITLGGWLREYVFYPLLRSNAFRKLKKWCRKRLGKNYEKKFDLPLYLGLFITWFFIGFWHGGQWNYIFGSGLYYWFLIFLGGICAPLLECLIRILHINTQCSSYRLFQRFRTFCIFTFGLSFFRAPNLREGIMMWKATAQISTTQVIDNGTVLGLGLDGADMIVLAAALAVLIAVGLLRLYLKQNIRGWFNEQNILFRGSIVAVAIVCVVIFGMYGPGVTASEFIYQQF